MSGLGEVGSSTKADEVVGAVHDNVAPERTRPWCSLSESTNQRVDGVGNDPAPASDAVSRRCGR
jgi:hypothetical protein